jgi:L-lactate utilization protein LutC
MNYDELASKESVDSTVKALEEKGYSVFAVENGPEALAKIKELIPEKASVVNGTSKTLEQIGYLDFLKSDKTGWNNLLAKVTAESDPQKRRVLRRQATISDYYLGSVHALTEDGQMVIASNTGSQMPSITFNSSNLIFVLSTKKIVPSLDEAMKRLEEHVFPLEDKHMKDMGAPGTMLSKVLIFKRENPMLGRKVNIILVSQNLGF